MIELGSIKIFTDKEVADRLGVSVRRIRSFIKKGQLTARRVGKAFHITEKKLEEFLECESVVSTSTSTSTPVALPSGDMVDDIACDMADDISRLDAILGNNKKS
jgi:excisionase family DNA binding protein